MRRQHGQRQNVQSSIQASFAVTNLSAIFKPFLDLMAYQRKKIQKTTLLCFLAHILQFSLMINFDTLILYIYF